MVGQMASWIEIWLRRLDSLVVDNGGAFNTDMSAELDDLTKDILARSSFGSSFAKGKQAFRHQENHKRLLLQQQLFSNPHFRCKFLLNLNGQLRRVHDVPWTFQCLRAWSSLTYARIIEVFKYIIVHVSMITNALP